MDFGGITIKSLGSIEGDNADDLCAKQQDELVRQRIKEVLKQKKTSFTALTGNGTALYGKFQRQLRNASVSFEIVQFIANQFPDVSPKWLLLGSGSMFEDDTPIVVNAPNNKNSGNQVIGTGTINDSKSDSELIRELFEQNKKLQDALIDLINSKK